MTNEYGPWGGDGVFRIQNERRRQVEVEGWTPEHDDEHDACEMVMAAGCYAWHAVGQVNGVCWPDDALDVPGEWPWHPDWWKPDLDPIRNLVRAAALIAAEIDRLQRMAVKGEPSDG